MLTSWEFWRYAYLSFTQLDDGSLLLDSDDLQDLAEIVRTNLISGG